MPTAKLQSFFEEDTPLSLWLQLHRERTPELLEQQESEILWLGLLTIAVNSTPVTIIRQVPQCNMFIGLVGEPGTGKTTEMNLIKSLCPQIPHGTPEAIAEWLQNNAGGIYCVDEIGGLIKNVRKQGYMTEWGYLLNSAYTGEDIILKRRKKDKEVLAFSGSYWFNCLFNGLEEDYSGIFTEYKALKRRLLPLRFNAEFPDEIDLMDVQELDLYEDLKKTMEEMRNSIHLCLVPRDIINSNINKTKEIRKRTVDRRIRLLIRDYTVKALMCCLINSSYAEDSGVEVIEAKSSEFEEVLYDFAHTEKEKERSIEIINNSNKNNSLEYIQHLQHVVVRRMEKLSLLVNKKDANLKVLYIKSNRSPTLYNTFDKVLTTLYNTYNTLVLGESYDPEFEKQAERVIRYVERYGVTTRREVSMNLRIKAKDLEEIERTESIRGRIRLRYLGKGRVEYYSPSFRVCLNCKRFEECSQSKWVKDEKGELDIYFAKECDSFELEKA
jgi:hypothetical protein